MKTEQPNADKWNSVDADRTERTEEMPPDEQVRFEQGTIQRADADATVPDDADRLTKSGRLSISEVRQVQGEHQ